MISVLKKVTLFLTAVLLVSLLMALLPILIEIFSSSSATNRQFSKARIRPAAMVKKRPPEKKKKIHLRSTKAKSLQSATREQSSFQFVPDLSVSSEAGASAGTVDLEVVLFEEDEIDQPPRTTFIKRVTYPERARDAGIEGVVTLIIIVGRDGNVESVVFEKLPDPLFRRSVESQVRRWKFDPGKKDGIPVRVKVRQSLEFFLD